METRRKTLGKRIQRERLLIGLNSAREFADAVTAQLGKISERSVAGAETGEEKIGRKVFGLLETFLGYRPGAFNEYLETGDEDALEKKTTAAPPGASALSDPSGIRRKRVVDMDGAELFELAEYVAEVRGKAAAAEWMEGALRMQAEHRQAVQERAAQTFERSAPNVD